MRALIFGAVGNTLSKSDTIGELVDTIMDFPQVWYNEVSNIMLVGMSA